MTIATVVTRGYGTFAATSYVPPLGYGQYNNPNVGGGRLEFTLPKSLMEYSMIDSRLEFTLPKSKEEFSEE